MSTYNKSDKREAETAQTRVKRQSVLMPDPLIGQTQTPEARSERRQSLRGARVQRVHSDSESPVTGRGV